MEEAKIGFLNRIKKAIFKFDEYEKFVKESMGKAFGYLSKLIFIFSLIITITLIFVLKHNIRIFTTVLDREFPEFTVTNGTLTNGTLHVSKMEDDIIEYNYYVEDANLVITINDTAENSTNTDYKNSIELIKNKIILKYNGFVREIPYEDMELSKQIIIGYLQGSNLTLILCTIGFFTLLITFLVYFIVFLVDIITLAILGLIINILIRTQFKFQEIFKISVYSMTLPIILYLIYIVANIVTGVTIKYFEIAYNAISYIYLVTVLLIMKSDIIKNKQELQKVLDEEKKVKEELARQKQEEKEKQEQEEREKEKDKEKGKKKKEKAPKEEPQTEN